ncbi:hypothetical protein Hanom_Chr02g00138051 [Helianthus anomalus]
MSDIENLFPYVMDRNVELQSEPLQNRELPISDANQKAIDTGKKRKDKKARVEPNQKKAAVIPTVKKPDEVAHDATIEDSDDDFDNPPWKKMKSDPCQPVAQSSENSKTHRRSTTIKSYPPLSDGKLTLRTALKHIGELVQSLNANQRAVVKNIGFGSILGF